MKNSKLLPVFEGKCRAWYEEGYHNPNRGARWNLYRALFKLYGPLAVTRHATLVRDALDHAEARARNGGNGKCTS